LVHGEGLADDRLDGARIDQGGAEPFDKIDNAAAARGGDMGADITP
jgi:hypothetical protein